MIEPERAAERVDSSSLALDAPERVAEDGRAVRFLLIRTKAGELPWQVLAMKHLMAPVDLVQVVAGAPLAVPDRRALHLGPDAADLGLTGGHRGVTRPAGDGRAGLGGDAVASHRDSLAL